MFAVVQILIIMTGVIMTYLYDASAWATFFKGYFTDSEKKEPESYILGDYCEN